jgi:hypothetical protein
MRNFTLDLSQLTVVPTPSMGTRVIPRPRTQKSSLERAAIQVALEGLKSTQNKYALALETLEISTKPTSVTIIPSSSVPLAKTARYFTAAFGLTGTASWVVGLNLGGGIYVSNLPEFGIYGTGGFVIGLVTGAGAGYEYTFIFGTPADFSGIFLAIQCSVGPKIFAGAALGGSLLFSPKIGPGGTSYLAFMGFSVNLSVSVGSVLPASLSVEWSYTTVKPLLY